MDIVVIAFGVVTSWSGAELDRTGTPMGIVRRVRIRKDATRRHEMHQPDTMHIQRNAFVFFVLSICCFGQNAWAEAGHSLFEGSLPRPEGTLTTGFFTVDGRLRDALGNDFVMRGVNHPVAWHPAEALAWLDEIALTGANSVRLVWETDHPTQTLRDAVARSIQLQMVPMIELHDISDGVGIDQPSEMAAYYAGELRELLLEFESHLLINIANEWNGGLDIYSEAYRRAITLLRAAGINHTLVIDANGFGQAGETLISEGPALLQFDPQHNLVFSLHMYEEFEQPEHILDILRQAVEARIPFVVGEFAFRHGNVPAIPFPVMLQEAERLGLGYLAWVWSGHNDGDVSLDLSFDGSAAELTAWGNDLVNGPFGIRATSRPASVFLELLDVPAVDVPAVDVPAVDVPAVDVPAVDVPAVDVPAVDVPAVDVPAVDVPAVDVPEDEAFAAGGLLLWDVCFPLCASADTDPDEDGNLDGWGYEHEASCIVSGSAFAAQAVSCSPVAE